MAHEHGLPTLKIPQQNLDTLSFAAPQVAAVQSWVDDLPMMNIGESAKRLYAAIQEINNCNMAADKRLNILEAVRPAILHVCSNLNKHFLNKAVILPARESKIAALSQALQNHLAVGYKIVIVASIAKGKKLDRNTRLLMVKAIHRAMTEQAGVLIRSMQLYCPPPTLFWKEVHALYLLAEHFDLLDIPVNDDRSLLEDSSCLVVYKTLLLLATAKPNQLRQNQIKPVFDAAMIWTDFCEFKTNHEEGDLFAIDLMSDAAPTYLALLKQQENSHVYFFDASRVSDYLREYLELSADQVQLSNSAFRVPEVLPRELIRLLVQAWGVLSERAFTRIEEYTQLQICVGLSATHYYISDRADFDAMVRTEQVTGISVEENRFEKQVNNRRHIAEKGDVWGLQVSLDKSMMTKTSSLEEEIAKFSNQEDVGKPYKYPSFSCKVINTSPGGFCLSWSQDVPPQVKTGEIIGIQEKEQTQWSVGVIRWVKQFKNEGARIGVQLLAPTAMVCGIQGLQKTGNGTEFMRALILPGVRAVKQPETLLTPNIAFKEGDKVQINRDGELAKACLHRAIASTASYIQFTYSMLSGQKQDSSSPPPGNHDTNNDDFDSIWSKL